MDTLAITIYRSMMGKLVNTREIRVMEGILGMKHQWTLSIIPNRKAFHFNRFCRNRAYLWGQISKAPSLLARAVFIPSFIKKPPKLIIQEYIERNIILANGPW